MTKLIARFTQDDAGATAIEYGLIVALIAVVIITAVAAIGTVAVPTTVQVLPSAET